VTGRDNAASPLLVRVEVAGTDLDAPARLVCANLADPTALAAAHPDAEVRDGRLRAHGTVDELAAAAETAGGTQLAEVIVERARAALTAWFGPPPDVAGPAGVLETSRRTLVLGVLNVTPDSFFDGGVHYAPERPADAARAGLALVEAGADLVDVGGESARPGAEPVDADEELRRVVPVVEALAAEGVAVSIDTTKARVARAAVEAGAVLVNDISAGTLDVDLFATVAELEVPYVLMHMRGTPRTMQDNPRYADVVADVHDHLGARLADLERAGVPAERVVVDPGIGFGKTVEHNVALLRRLRELTGLGRPVLVGASRKSFLGALTGQPDPGDRLEASLAAAVLAVTAGASIVRVHDVAETARVLAVADAVARGDLRTPGRHMTDLDGA
jgi:dihydropteroate synthase